MLLLFLIHFCQNQREIFYAMIEPEAGKLQQIIEEDKAQNSVTFKFKESRDIPCFPFSLKFRINLLCYD